LCKPAAIPAESMMSMQGRIRKCALTGLEQRARAVAALRQIAARQWLNEGIADASGSIAGGCRLDASEQQFDHALAGIAGLASGGKGGEVIAPQFVLTQG